MQKIENPELSRLILDHLADLYNIKKRRDGIHLSTLVYCLTRSFFDQVAPIEPTDQEVMLFSLGFGLQDVLTPKGAVTPTYEMDGITFSPDFVLEFERSGGYTVDSERFVELKTTRMSSGKEDFPETWLEYIMGGCFMQGIKEYQLSVLHMLGNYKPPFPEIKSYKLIFDEEELVANWEYLVNRMDIYAEAIESNKPPAPFTYCKEWECKNCRYKMQCQALVMVTNQEVDENYEAAVADLRPEFKEE